MLYDIAFFIFSLLYIPALLFRGKLHRDFGERFGIYAAKTRERLKDTSHRQRIWIQAVSVGEVNVCKSIIGRIQKRYPDAEIVLSTITKTGQDVARKNFSTDAIIIYFPLDISWIVRRVVRLVRPTLYIMVETELWPNLLRELARQSVPAIVINGRISDRSFGNYKLAAFFLRRTLNTIAAFCMQSATDAERIRSLGVAASKVMVTGNMKFDLPSAASRSADEMRRWLLLGSSDELLVGGSTHEGEDEILIDVFKGLTGAFPRLRLLLAPRHLERINFIEDAAHRAGIEAVRVSRLGRARGAAAHAPVLILDSMGHLNDVYSIATIVFVGGSLVRYGGHNPIEPALFAKPIIFGPYMFNFAAIADAFVRADAVCPVTDRDALYTCIERLLRDDEARARAGANAQRIVAENRGASDRNMQMIERLVR